MKKTVIITGATSGFGEAAARCFVADDWKVIATGRRLDRLQKLREELGNEKIVIEKYVENAKSEPWHKYYKKVYI